MTIHWKSVMVLFGCLYYAIQIAISTDRLLKNDTESITLNFLPALIVIAALALIQAIERKP